MEIPTNSFYCDGCSQYFKQIADIRQHWARTKQNQCVDAFQSYQNQLCQEATCAIRLCCTDSLSLPQITIHLDCPSLPSILIPHGQKQQIMIYLHMVVNSLAMITMSRIFLALELDNQSRMILSQLWNLTTMMIS